MWIAASAARSGWAKLASSTLPSTIVAPFAANTWSGSPGDGSQ